MGQTAEQLELIFKASEEEEHKLFHVFRVRFSYTLLNILYKTSDSSSNFCVKDEESLKSDTRKNILNVWFKYIFHTSQNK